MNERRKAIFITGAATGIGRATALLFSEKGWYVGGVDVKEKELEALRGKQLKSATYNPDHPVDPV